MNLFECRYYWLNRKLLTTFGLWPYQRNSPNIYKHVLVFVSLLSLTAAQIAKLVTVGWTTDITAEILSDQVSTFTCMTKYMIYIINKNKVKDLLENIKTSWECATNDDLKILHDMTEKGRKYNLYFMFYYSCAFPIIVVVYLAPSILDYVLPRNEPYPKTMLLPAEYFVDQEKYFNIIFLHTSVVITLGLSVIIAADTLFNAFVYHACGLFKVASHRLEQVFDACQDEDEKLNKRMASVQTRIMLAVEWHKNATEFTEDIVAAYGIFYFMSLVPMLCAISVTLYCTAKYLQQHKLSVLPLIYTTTQMIHILFMVIPAQKLTEYSAEIPLKAYSGLWYAAPSSKQTSILLVIQRGLRPSVIVTGKMLVASLETYLTVMQSCVSYFMVFLSIG